MKKRQPTEKQQAILSRLKEYDPDLELQWNEALGIPQQIRGRLSAPSDKDPQIVAREFLIENSELFRFEDVNRDLQVKRVKRGPRGTTHIRLQQTHQGISIFGSQLLIHVAADNTIQSVNGVFHPALKVASQPEITQEDAVAAAIKHVGEATEIPGQEPYLEIYENKGDHTLCWHVRLDGMEDDKPAQWEYFIDSQSGEVVFRFNNLKFHDATTGWGRGRYTGCGRLQTFHNHDIGTYQLRDTSRGGIEVRTYDMDGSTNRDNLTLSSDPDNRWNNTNRTPRRNSQEPEVDAHQYTGMVLDYFMNINTFDRNGWDDMGSNSEVCVHYGINQIGSFWDPARSRVYHPDGDGINVDYKPGLDVVAHEFSHGVTEAEVDFNYPLGESAALCEAYSDFFACMVQEDWLFEEHVYLGATAPTDALRSLHDPTLYGKLDHYSNVGANLYENSGIVTKAGYLMTHGGTHHGIEVFGLGRRITEQIWYEALYYLLPSSNFADFRGALESACDDLYPGNTYRKAIVQNAMAAVGIGDSVSYPNCPALLSYSECEFIAMVGTPGEYCAYSIVQRIPEDFCLTILEPEPSGCTFRPEPQGPCCIREYIVDSRQCSFSYIHFDPGPICTRENIFEIPFTELCSQGDTTVFDPRILSTEPMIVGRLTRDGRVQPLAVQLPEESQQPRRHVRVLTQRRRR